jgi:hypothetical protein
MRRPGGAFLTPPAATNSAGSVNAPLANHTSTKMYRSGVVAKRPQNTIEGTTSAAQMTPRRRWSGLYRPSYRDGARSRVTARATGRAGLAGNGGDGTGPPPVDASTPATPSVDMASPSRTSRGLDDPGGVRRGGAMPRPRPRWLRNLYTYVGKVSRVTPP